MSSSASEKSNKTSSWLRLSDADKVPSMLIEPEMVADAEPVAVFEPEMEADEEPDVVFEPEI